MAVATFPAFVGLKPEAASALVAMADRHGWDAEAIAAVIERESGWDPKAGLSRWNKRNTATGLIQFTEATAAEIAKRIGFEKPDSVEFFTRDWIGNLSQVEQLPLVEQFYLMSRFDTRETLRPGDYYAAPFGKGIGAPEERILVDGDSDEQYQPGFTHREVYAINKGLDGDKDGNITFADLQKKVTSAIARARARGEIALGSPPSGGGSTGVKVAMTLVGVGLAALARHKVI